MDGGATVQRIMMGVAVRSLGGIAVWLVSRESCGWKI